jgi:hypothetical protein
MPLMFTLTTMPMAAGPELAQILGLAALLLGALMLSSRC